MFLKLPFGLIELLLKVCAAAPHDGNKLLQYPLLLSSEDLQNLCNLQLRRSQFKTKTIRRIYYIQYTVPPFSKAPI